MEICILVTSAGRRTELIELLRADAEDLGLKPRIIAADLKPGWSTACYAADKVYCVPPGDSPEYASAIFSIIEAENIRLLVPTIDTELLSIAAHREEWERRRQGLFVVSHSAEFVKICRDKSATMDALAAIGIDVPFTYFSPDAKPKSLSGAQWPLIAKPFDGSASREIKDIRDELEFERTCGVDGLMIQEKVRGPEYTVNAYVDRFGKLITVVPHRRISTRGGEVEKGVTEELLQAESAVARLVDATPGMRGPFNLQGILRENGSFAIFEINARLGGGYPLAHHAGAPFTRWAMEEGLLGRELEPVKPEYGWRLMRCDRSLFVHGNG